MSVKELVAEHIGRIASGEHSVEAQGYEGVVEAIDEELMRLYIWGDVSPRSPCTAFIDTIEGRTKAKKFPVKFLYTLIHHMVRCEDCFKAYSERFPSP